MASRVTPTQPITGKNSKVYISTNDGTQLTLEEMTVQASKRYRGRIYEKQIYLLGEGKTLINTDPEFQPEIVVDGILSGGELSVGSAVETIDVSSLIIEVDGEEKSVSAGTVAVAGVASSDNYQYAAIVVEDIDTTPALAAVVQTGEGVESASSLTGDFGTGVGDIPYIPTNAILLGVVIGQMNAGGTAFLAFEAANIDTSNREMAGVGYQLLPNLGGALLTDGELLEAHTAGVARPVKFTGRYLDDSLSLIGTAKSWSMTPSANTISEDTFNASYNETEMGGWTFQFEQLATDDKAIDAMLERGGKFAIRALYANNKGFQSVATGSTPLESAVGSMLPLTISGSLADMPEKYFA